MIGSDPTVAGGEGDVNNGRQRWGSRFWFVISCVGYSIGLGNVWKFPALTQKHGGPSFILFYLISILLVGIPMIILELTLGQKFQRGAAGSFRGIVPRLAGAGWAASFAGLVQVIVYNILIAISLMFFFRAGDEPWMEKNVNRTPGCSTASKMSIPAEEIFLYMNVTRLFSETTCEKYEVGDPLQFSVGLWLCVLFAWAITMLSISFGPKSIKWMSLFTVTIPFILLFVVLSVFVGENNSASGNGIGIYFNLANFTLPLQEGATSVKQYDASSVRNSILYDAYSQVFYSLGICLGAFQSYSSFNKIKQPIIQNTIMICMLDFMYAMIAGFAVYSAIGYLQIMDHPTYSKNSSVSLTFIAIPVMASLSENTGILYVFFLMLFFSGIGCSAGFAQSLVQNISDGFEISQFKASFMVCLVGVSFSTLLCTNFGWVLFDMFDHQISAYIVPGIGLLQCISVGWIFEAQSTRMMSRGHMLGQRVLGVMFWVPVVCLTLYAHWGFSENSIAGAYALIGTTLLAMLCSWYASKMPMRIWYHEICLCGVDKVAHAITSLSYKGERVWWMLIFEAYFGVLIKYFNPIMFLYMMQESLALDVSDPYGDQDPKMQALASLPLFFTLMILVTVLFVCDWPEVFRYNINEEFNADHAYVLALRGIVGGGTQQLVGGGHVEMKNDVNTSQTPIVPVTENLKGEDF